METTKLGQPRPSATVTAPRATTGGLRGQKAPYIHRLFLTDGRVIRGELHRMPNNRLGDHLSMQKGFLSVTNAVCEKTNESYRYIVVVLSNVLFLEEMDGPGVGPEFD